MWIFFTFPVIRNPGLSYHLHVLWLGYDLKIAILRIFLGESDSKICSQNLI